VKERYKEKELKKRKQNKKNKAKGNIERRGRRNNGQKMKERTKTYRRMENRKEQLTSTGRNRAS
jgi:hypothetical protein